MKILKSLALATLLVAPIVGNASVNLGPIATGSTVSFGSGSLSGSFTEQYDFSTAGNVGIAALLANMSFSLSPASAVPGITSFAATLDGTALSFTSTPSSQAFGPFTFNVLTILGAGGIYAPSSASHSLMVSGTAAAGTSFTGLVSVAAVPLPAGVWLFMSGLMGVLYTGKKKAQQA